MARHPPPPGKGETVTLEMLEACAAILAQVIKDQGAAGRDYLPLFDRIEYERESLINREDRLKRAIARVA